jgi:hypothetical protein
MLPRLQNGKVSIEVPALQVGGYRDTYLLRCEEIIPARNTSQRVNRYIMDV